MRLGVPILKHFRVFTFTLCFRFATIDSMRHEEKSDDSSSDEEGQAFYAGGSERRYHTILILINVPPLINPVPFHSLNFNEGAALAH